MANRNSRKLLLQLFFHLADPVFNGGVIADKLLIHGISAMGFTVSMRRKGRGYRHFFEVVGAFFSFGSNLNV